MNYSINTTNLTKKYNKHTVVNNLSISVPENAVYGFLGPNGAGKTTTLKMILGLVHKTDGNIEILGNKLNQKNRLKILKNIGSLIESPSYYGHLTARENLEIIRSLRNLPKSEIDEVLNIVRLTEVKNKQVSKFSLGMKQRLGIAASLMGKPKILLLDEPTNGLDPSGIHEMRELIKSLPKKYNMTVIVSSHLLSEIDQIADYVGIINKGKLIFEDTLENLHKNSKSNIAIRTNDNNKALKIIENAVKDRDWLYIPNISDKKAADLSLLLAKNNIGIIRMEKREQNLEDIFISMTEMEDII